MKYWIFYTVTLLLLIGCGGGDNAEVPPPVVDAPPPVIVAQPDVFTQPTFNVDVSYDVKFGEGLRHAYWNAPDPEVVDLLLDVYRPSGGDANNHPVVMFIHGGGFTAGDKSFSRISDFLHYFAERGFVGFSVNYRLQSDYGTVPQDVIDYVDGLSDLSDNAKNRVKAMYPATRDAKAALRWIIANKDEYGLNTDYVTVIGGSAGSVISIALGVTEPGDFTNELSENEDPTLSSTHVDITYNVDTVINNWGTGAAVNLINDSYGVNRWDETDAPTLIIHGVDDHIYSYDEALALQNIFTSNNVSHELHPLENTAHGDWDAIIDGKSLSELSFEFVLSMQDIQPIN